MHSFSIYILSALVASFFLFGEALAQQVQRRILDARSPIYCPVSPLSTLTITFPEKLEAVNGVGFLRDSEKGDCDYLMSYQAGSRFLSLAPKSAKVPCRNLNVVMGGKNHVLIIYIPKRPDEAWMSLSLEYPRRAKDTLKPDIKQREESIKKSLVKPIQQIQAPTPAQLLGLIDSTKLLSSVDSSERSKLVTLMPHLDVRWNVGQKTNNGIYLIEICSAIRNKKMDAVCFELTIQNLTNHELKINPESFAVRVGSSVYAQIMSDSIMTIAPDRVEKAYFVICGNGSGSHNWISTENNFVVSVDLF